MASVPISQTPGTQPIENLEDHFQRLAAAWRKETAELSSSTAIISHPAYQEIIGMGQAVVPLMLRELEKKPSLWVWALPKITGVNPVPPEDRGRIAKMAEAWLHWGRENGYRW